MRFVFYLSAVLLVGEPAVAQEPPRVVGMMGFETYVVVAPVADEASALADAEWHCAKYNRFANFRRMDGLRAVFDCDTRKIDKQPSGMRGRGLF